MITSEIHNKHILWATIRRPEARNAINYKVIDDLEALVERLEKDRSIRVFIISGEGTQAFVAGGDLREFHSITTEKAAREMSERMHQLFLRIEQLDCWTLCYLNGDAYGGGIELMLAFDFRLARKGIKLGFTQGRFYLSPGWGGLTRLIEKVGRAKALELLGKSTIINAHSALQMDLVEHLIPEEKSIPSVLAWVDKLTTNDRKYIRTLKLSAFQHSETRVAAMKQEIEPFAKLWIDPEHQRRVNDFIQKNKK